MRIPPLGFSHLARAQQTCQRTPAQEENFSFAQNKDWFDAGSLMSQRGIPTDGYQLLQENLASFLAHRQEGKPLPTGRWETKIERELAQPYSDKQVFDQVDSLQKSLQENLAQLPTYPGRVYLTGSFSKGRLGANSDLNGYAKVEAKDFDHTFEVFGRRFSDSQSAQKANLFPFSESSPGFNKAMLMVEGSSLEIPTAKLEEPGYLRELYRDVLTQKKVSRIEIKPAFDGLTGKMWRSKFERETFHFKAMRWSLHGLGSLSRVPLLGALIEGGMARIIPQNHRTV